MIQWNQCSTINWRTGILLKYQSCIVLNLDNWNKCFNRNFRSFFLDAQSLLNDNPKAKSQTKVHAKAKSKKQKGNLAYAGLSIKLKEQSLDEEHLVSTDYEIKFSKRTQCRYLISSRSIIIELNRFIFTFIHLMLYISSHFQEFLMDDSDLV